MNAKDYVDARGWKQGKARKYTDADVATRICSLKQKRIDDNKYFVGNDYIRMDYSKQYPQESLPSKWYFDEVVRKAALQTRKPKRKKRGGSKYLLYPLECIKRLGYVHQSADFIGKKYITGRSEPVHVFSSSYYAPFKLYRIARIKAEKSSYCIEELSQQWKQFPLPDVFRMDNGLQFRGTGSGKRSLGIFLKFLLNLDITPLFGSPSKPWTNPHVEGHNRVFNEKLWRREHFTSLHQIDQAARAFNQESLEYFSWRYQSMINSNRFRYLSKSVVFDQLCSQRNKRVCFIRFVESYEKQRYGFIVILNETIRIPEKYTHQFVFVQWEIEKEHLLIFSEFEQNIMLILKLPFKLNL